MALFPILHRFAEDVRQVFFGRFFRGADEEALLFHGAFDEVVYKDVPLPSPLVKYPFWHQMDSYEGMVELAGSEADLEAGFANVGTIGAELLAYMAGDVDLVFTDASVEG